MGSLHTDLRIIINNYQLSIINYQSSTYIYGKEMGY